MNATWKRLFLVLPALMLISATASAEKINLIFSDVDITYQGSSNLIHDTPDSDGGNQAEDESDPIASTIIEVEDSILPILNDPNLEMFVDILFEGLPSSIPLGGVGLQPLVTSGFGFEWFTSAGHNLHLQIDKVDVLLTSGVFFFTAEAVVVSQNLPEGIEFDGEVNLSYTATAPAVSQGGTSTSLALSSGALTVTGIALVPEPGTALVLLSALALCVPLRRTHR